MRNKTAPANSDTISEDDFEYSERSEYWRNYRPKAGRGRPQKFNYRQPLILSGHGVRIRIDHNTLLIRDGFTHYPQKSQEIRYFPGDGNLPDRIIILDGNGGITFDALDWMSSQKIEFIRLDWRGRITAISSNSGYSALPHIVQAQKDARSGPRRLEIARWLLDQKMEGCISTLENMPIAAEVRDRAISRIAIQKEKMRRFPRVVAMSSILGTEGQSASSYFRAWQGIPLKWAGIKMRPIPEDWSRTVARAMAWQKRARSARHPVNAMLNYGYGILASQLRSYMVAAGLDPTIGIIHGNSGNRIPLVYDLMEPLRPTVDLAVFKFALSHTFAPGDFTITKWGGCRLNPQMAKVVATLTSTLDASLITRRFLQSL